MTCLKYTIGYGLGNRYFRILWWIGAFTILGTIVGALIGILLIEYYDKRDWGKAYRASKARSACERRIWFTAAVAFAAIMVRLGI